MTDSTKTYLIWLRDDLRTADNPALSKACEAALEENADVIAVFTYDTDAAGDRFYGGATRWWLHHALVSMQDNLHQHHIPLIIRQGDSLKILQELCQQTGATHVMWNRRYASWQIKQDKAVKETLTDAGIEAQSFNGHLLIEPWEIATGNGDPYKVFTPFWKKSSPIIEENIRPLYECPKMPKDNLPQDCNGLTIDALDLLPQSPDWSQPLRDYWFDSDEAVPITEQAAFNRLQEFLDGPVATYKQERNNPDRDGTTRLSPFLRFGMISPHTIWHETQKHLQDGRISDTHRKGLNHFLSEIGWREFSYNLIYHFPTMTDTPLNARFDEFPWRDGRTSEVQADLKRWQRGETGIPIVDAGMRQLWQTGWMHNRVRMIVGSLLVKNLLIHWHFGESWFWDTLVDADPANNVASWQWIAGCGADAAPYFRIFNPVLQGEKFDPKGDYVRRWVPELRNMPDKYLHKPWEASQDMFQKSAPNYPEPIIDLRESRDRALSAYDVVKG